MANTLDSNTIRIRMYRVGFGDCFLVSLPLTGNGGFRHVLVDCGVHAKGNIGTMDEVVDNIGTATDKKLAIVIATHAHQDHISGFDGTKFGKFEIGEVWMPWTEDPNDPRAAKLKKEHVALAAQLDDHFAAQASRSPRISKSRAAASAAVANLVANKSALQALHSGFGVNARIRFFKAGDSLQSLANVPGLSVSILGPPTDEKFLAKMDPPSGHSYLRLDGNHIESVNQLRPLGEKWTVKANAPELKHLRLSQSDKKRLQDDVAGDSLDGLAFALDKAINNTSIVTLFSFRGQTLLFPGDAQYGNWEAWLEQDGSADILSRIGFLKVAHHGSVNATPKDALEKMSTGKFAAMVSTQNTPWPSIPRGPLMDRLKQQTKNKIVRSDSLSIKNLPKAPKGPAVSKLPSGFVKGDFWYDYFIKL
jgi:beta-lactamase superfamily II metal-dependent hydrolase